MPKVVWTKMLTLLIYNAYQTLILDICHLLGITPSEIEAVFRLYTYYVVTIEMRLYEWLGKLSGSAIVLAFCIISLLLFIRFVRCVNYTNMVLKRRFLPSMCI